MPGNIVLIGFMGAGKSTVGRALALRLGFRFYDTDEMVERSAKRSIQEIFDDDGEEKFRTLERRALKRAVNGDRRVIACGGGAVLHLDNLEMARAAGAVVYLRARLETLRERLRDPKGRPLLRAPGALDRLYAQRHNAYEAAADVVVDVDDGTAEDVADRVVEALR